MDDEQSRRAAAPRPKPGQSGFPFDFAWGAATAAYQIEGAPRADGKGESIWDRFTHTPGHIDDGSTGDTACDHYHRWPEDLDLLARLGLNAYRFSIAWTRIQPEGRGQINLAGLDYYERLLDGLLMRGITPYVTLYHWDLPQALEDRGGWQNRDTAGFFADYAQALAKRLGDRVGHWITHNEPRVVVYEGFVRGSMAPGIRNARLIAPVAHHLLLSHGLAVQAIRAESAPTTQVGITLDFSAIEPATDRAEDEEAARLLDGLWARWFLDPLVRGSYPDDVRTALTMPDDLIHSGDSQTIATPIDFLGVNYYTRYRARAGRTRRSTPEPRTVPFRGKATTMGWEVYPHGLTQVLQRLHQDYALPALYITENGAAYPDVVAADGSVNDPLRERYLREHLSAARRAIELGVPLRGYFVWSLMDNFEWARGYVPRFGIVYVDYATQARIIKASGRLLSEVAATNGALIE